MIRLAAVVLVATLSACAVQSGPVSLPEPACHGTPLPTCTRIEVNR